MVPKNIKDAFHQWAAEVMNQGVHVHSKVIVIDPFGKKPVVMTGSHNLGYKASTKNDDNLMIVEGNAPLAAAYAANIIAIYQTYRWNSYVVAHEKDPQVWHGLVDNTTWQDSYLTGDDLAEIEFWLGKGQAAPSAAGQPVAAPAAGGQQVRAATSTGPSPNQGSGGKRTPAKTQPASKGKRVSARKVPAKTRPAARRVAAKKPAAKKVAAKKPAAKRFAAKKKTATRKAKPAARRPRKN